MRKPSGIARNPSYGIKLVPPGRRGLPSAPFDSEGAARIWVCIGEDEIRRFPCDGTNLNKSGQTSTTTMNVNRP